MVHIIYLLDRVVSVAQMGQNSSGFIWDSGEPDPNFGMENHEIGIYLTKYVPLYNPLAKSILIFTY